MSVDRKHTDDAVDTRDGAATQEFQTQLVSDPLTALPRYRLESASPTSALSFISHSTADSSPDSPIPDPIDAAESGVASVDAITTFVPQQLARDAEADGGEDDSFDLLSDQSASDDGYANDSGPPDSSADQRDDSNRFDEDDNDSNVIKVSHSFASSPKHSRDVSVGSAPASGFSSRRASHSSASFMPSLSTSWPSLPPRAVRLHRRRREILLRLLKTWEGREQALQLTHSLVLMLHSTLDVPAPRTYLEVVLRPGGALLSSTFPHSIRSATMQRIYTAAEGIDNLRRVILIARWITSATQAAMDHWQKQSLHRAQLSKRQREEADFFRLTGEEPVEKDSDRLDDGFSWLQPQSIAPLDHEKHESSHAEKDGPALSKLGKVTGRGDATGAVGADVAENKESPGDLRTVQRPDSRNASSASPAWWRKLWSKLELDMVTETLATLGEACEVSAFLAGGGLFWRAVGFQRWGMPFLSRRRRRGIERLGILFSLCSVMLSLLVLRIERQRLRADVRSAHRRIIRANDRIGWASDLAGTHISTRDAISYRKNDPARVAARQRSTSREAGSAAIVENMGSDLRQTLEDLDDDDDVSDDQTLSSDSPSQVADTHDDPSYFGSAHSHHHRPHPHHEHERDQHPHPLSPTPLLRSTERSLIRAESDLKKARRSIRVNFWEKIAFWSESIFLAYEAARPNDDKESVEAWTGILSSSIRLANLWSMTGWSRSKV
ncbi:hypothetical protein BCV70DRAFT_201171 [Testicularia cyperi]|uniref:Uncharacterized protein n=1 Tax=Testicularia cyperi TaxID=1882483 RepID=A0A317XKY4_9BASI|nr:hypothetical protein BCV70DRAFT_201171 [Testicularia cyperi]